MYRLSKVKSTTVRVTFSNIFTHANCWKEQQSLICCCPIDAAVQGSGQGRTLPPTGFIKFPPHIRLACAERYKQKRRFANNKKTVCGVFKTRFTFFWGIFLQTRDNQKLKQQALQLSEMDDIQVVESKPLLVDRELQGLREAVQQLVVKVWLYKHKFVAFLLSLVQI
ncbi:hypothetical protein GOODEAATRI_022858 [Goodea atripinnis]|uniref:Uncharacterized protein n=1 Tax=Goodea atripinnis TaxID=208336 RepID=A0ABV0PG93_9TELE